MGFAVVLVSFIYLTRQGVHCGLFNAGPYNLKLVRHELCEDQGTGEAIQDFHIVKKSTHKAFLQGTATVPIDFDGNVHGQMNFSRLGSRGWGMNAYRLRSDYYCMSFKTTSSTLFKFFYKAWGIEKPSCPIKAGNYTMDLDTDLPRMPSFPYLPYGTYRVSHALSYGDPPVRMVCGVWYVTCTERPR